MNYGMATRMTNHSIMVLNAACQKRRTPDRSRHALAFAPEDSAAPSPAHRRSPRPGTLPSGSYMRRQSSARLGGPTASVTSSAPFISLMRGVPGSPLRELTVQRYSRPRRAFAWPTRSPRMGRPETEPPECCRDPRTRGSLRDREPTRLARCRRLCPTRRPVASVS